MQNKIDDAANMWNKTKDPKYKDLWYKLIKEYANGPHNIERWNVSVSSINKTNDGTCVFIGTSKLHGPVRDTETKINRVRRHTKPTHHE